LKKAAQKLLRLWAMGWTGEIARGQNWQSFFASFCSQIEAFPTPISGQRCYIGGTRAFIPTSVRGGHHAAVFIGIKAPFVLCSLRLHPRGRMAARTSVWGELGFSRAARQLG
jgi:hypothetical protein